MLRKYAAACGIKLQGFKNSDEDIELAKELIDDSKLYLERFPDIKGIAKKPFTLNLSYTISAYNFAITFPNADHHIVNKNGNIFRNKAILSQKYQKLSNGNFL